jgi:hypothetical protein
MVMQNGAFFKIWRSAVVAAASRISGIEAGCGHYDWTPVFSKHNTARLSAARYFLYNCNVTDAKRGFQPGGKIKQDEEYLLFSNKIFSQKGLARGSHQGHNRRPWQRFPKSFC